MREAPGAVARAWEIVRVLGAHLVFHRINCHRGKRLGVRMREACEELGTSFIKIGQLLSTRYELLEKEDCEELQKLFDRVPEFPYELAREIFLHDLGMYPEQAFARIEREPLSSASVAQVYVAWTHEGEKVAVKIRRPYIGKRFERDLAILRWIVAASHALFPIVRRLGVKEGVRAVSASLRREIDLRNEAGHYETLHEYLKTFGGRRIRDDLGTIKSPKVMREFCSYNVLTTEFLDGMPISKCPSGKAEEGLRALKTMINGSLRLMFEHSPYYFHADPHPGNLIMMGDGNIGLIDMGDLGHLTPQTAGAIARMLWAVYVRDQEGLMREMAAFGKADPSRLSQELRRDVVAFLDRSHGERLGFWFTGVLRMFAAHKLRLSPDFALFARTLIILDGLACKLDPSVTSIDLLGEEFEGIMRRRMLRNIRDVDVAPLLYVLSTQAKECPRRAAMLVERYADDPLRMVRDIRAGI